jgi:hypothetical protein
VTVTVRNWTLDLDPRVLNLSSNGGANSVTLYVEGENVALLLRVGSLALAVPGGAPVPATDHPAATTPGDRDGDGVPDLALKFDRAALVAALRGARAAGVLAGDRVPVSLLGGEYTLGVTAIDVR